MDEHRRDGRTGKKPCSCATSAVPSEYLEPVESGSRSSTCGCHSKAPCTACDGISALDVEIEISDTARVGISRAPPEHNLLATQRVVSNIVDRMMTSESEVASSLGSSPATARLRAELILRESSILTGEAVRQGYDNLDEFLSASASGEQHQAAVVWISRFEHHLTVALRNHGLDFTKPYTRSDVMIAFRRMVEGENHP